MIPFHPRVAFLLASFALASLAQGQTWKRDSILSPEDIGVQKVSLSASPGKNQVMVLRFTKTVGKNPPEVCEVISHTAGKEKTESVLMFNPMLFPFATAETRALPITIKYSGGGFSCRDLDLRDWGFGDRHLEFTFLDRDKIETHFTFDLVIEDLKAAIKRVPKLAHVDGNAHDGGWTYCTGRIEPGTTPNP